MARTDKKKASLVVPPVFPRARAIDAIRAQAAKGELFAAAGRVSYEELNAWSMTARAVVVGGFGEPSAAVSDFDRSVDLSSPLAFYATERERATDRLNAAKRAVNVLESCLEQLDLGIGGAQEDASTQPAVAVEAVAATLGFLSDDGLKALVERDLTELGRVSRVSGWKSSLLLCGSILEAILIDVLDRNRAVAGSYMGKRKFPDDASLNDLIRIAGDVALIDSTRYLLSKISVALSGTITEHRDLIHPHAELRGRMKVDKSTVDALVHLLGLVVRDLADAEARGDIAAYVMK